MRAEINLIKYTLIQIHISTELNIVRSFLAESSSLIGDVKLVIVVGRYRCVYILLALI